MSLTAVGTSRKCRLRRVRGRLWLQRGLRQTATGHVCPPVSAHSSARESLGIPQVVLRRLSYRARFATGSCRRRSASGVRIDCRRQQLPHTSSERPASAALLKTLSYVIFHDASSFAKTIMEDDIHPKQLRAARGLLNWSRGDLAAAAKTTERTIARLEDGASKPRASTADAIGKAFDKAGVMFIPENGGGRGVRLKKRGKR